MSNTEFFDNINELVKGLKSQNRSWLIGIDGRPASGKSTLADQLTDILKADAMFLDDFFIPQENWPKDIKPGFPFPYFRYEEFVNGLKTLSKGIKFTYRPYDWIQKGLGDPKTIDPQRIIIIEGVSVLSDETAPLLHKKILVISEQRDEFNAIAARENQQGLKTWQNLYLPSVEIYWKTRPWQRADIIFAGRGVKNKEEIGKFFK